MRTILLVHAIFLALTAHVFSSPLLKVIEGDTINNGTYFEGSYVLDTLHLINPTQDSLIIDKISPDCGCAEYRITKRTLGQNDTAELYIKINTADYTGHLLKHIDIISNDSTNKVKSITILTDIVPYISAKPYIVFSKYNSLDTVIRESFSLENNSQDTLFINNIVPSTGIDILSNMPVTLAPNGSVDIGILIKCNPKHDIIGSIKIYRNNADNPIIISIVAKLERTMSGDENE